MGPSARHRGPEHGTDQNAPGGMSQKRKWDVQLINSSALSVCQGLNPQVPESSGPFRKRVTHRKTVEESMYEDTPRQESQTYCCRTTPAKGQTRVEDRYRDRIPVLPAMHACCVGDQPKRCLPAMRLLFPGLVPYAAPWVHR